MHVLSECTVIELRAFYDAITGLTELFISIVNSVKMVNMPWHDYPSLRREKVSVCYYYYYYYYYYQYYYYSLCKISKMLETMIIVKLDN